MATDMTIERQIDVCLAGLQRKLDKGSSKSVRGTVDGITITLYRGESPWAADLRAWAAERGIQCGPCPTCFDDKKAKREQYMKKWREANADKLKEYMTKYNVGRRRRKPTEAKGEEA